MKNKFLHSLAYLCFFLTGCLSQKTDKAFLQKEAEYSKIRVEQVARSELTTIKFDDYHLRGDERLLYIGTGKDNQDFDKYADRFYKFCKNPNLPKKEELRKIVEKEGLRFLVTDSDIYIIKKAGFLDKTKNKAIMEILQWQDFLEMHRSSEERLRELEREK